MRIGVNIAYLCVGWRLCHFGLRAVVLSMRSGVTGMSIFIPVPAKKQNILIASLVIPRTRDESARSVWHVERNYKMKIWFSNLKNSR